MKKERIIEELRKLTAWPEMIPSPDGTEMFVKLGTRWETVTNIRFLLVANDEELMDELVDDGVPLEWVLGPWGERVDVM